MVARAGLLISFIFIATSCYETRNESGTSKTSVADTPEGAGIESRLRQYYEDFSSRDWQKFQSHFWNNATLTTSWQMPGDSIARVDVTTIDDFIREAPFGPGSQPIFEEKMKKSRIDVKGNLATAWVDYDVKFGRMDSLQQWSGTDVFTFLRHNREWKIVSIVFESE